MEIETFKQNPNPVVTIEWNGENKDVYKCETALFVGIIKGGKDDGEVRVRFVGHNSVAILELLGEAVAAKLNEIYEHLLKGA